jgi:ureidoacrylate peracid hydrolase
MIMHIGAPRRRPKKLVDGRVKPGHDGGGMSCKIIGAALPHPEEARMHKIELPKDVVERVAARRGRRHAFDPIEPARTALLVVDLQNYFMEPGQAGEVPFAREIVPNVNRLAHATRAAGGAVVWIRMTQSAEEMKRWSVFYGALNTNARGTEEMHRLSEGDHGHALWPTLETADGDLYVPKRRFSAFIQGSSGLEATLRARGIDTVIVTGTTTNTCCQATALDAMMLDFKVVFVADATATFTDAAHNAVLANILNCFGDVRTTAEIEALLGAPAQRAAAE